MSALLVLQHIDCEPPAAYEDEMRAWGVQIPRGDRRGRLAAGLEGRRLFAAWRQDVVKPEPASRPAATHSPR